MKRNRTLFMILATFTIIAMAAPADAQSSKAAWRFESLVSLPTASAASGGSSTTNDTGWVNILTTHIKTPNAKELAIGVSLQCGLVTDTTVRSKNGELDSSASRGKIAVRIKITQPDGTSVYAMPANDAIALDTDIPLNGDGVTYCDRYQKLEARFSGLNCTADLTTGAVTCADPEELRLLLKTLAAHHFNFLHANAVPGVQTVTVQARAQAGIALGGTGLGAAGAEAFAGAGALSVETIRLVKDADGTIDLENLR
jgi:hypothetical protein